MKFSPGRGSIFFSNIWELKKAGGPVAPRARNSHLTWSGRDSAFEHARNALRSALFVENPLEISVFEEAADLYRLAEK